MRLADCVPALSVTVKLPCRTCQTAIGLNVTLIVQLEFAASEVPQLLVWAKSPVVTNGDAGQGTRLSFVSVTACGGLVVPQAGCQTSGLSG